MLPVGANVRMSKRGKNTYRDALVNPHNSIGVVTSTSHQDYFIYRVRWASGKSNTYRVGDIEPADPINLEDLM